ncbi:MAG: heme o synthase [Coxiellaceae bacterium]|nr:heme o synthase [Coxiellaceae bacterium]
MVLTAFVAMLLAAPSGAVPWETVLFGCLGISFAAGAGGAINHLIDRHADAVMARTSGRPLPSGRVKLAYAIALASGLTILSMIILLTEVNVVAAILSFLSLVGYAGVYTLILKRATPQNIVIGGLAGAMPPLLGWSAMTGTITGHALLLVLIIFTWTPPHFWALAIYRLEEYKKANIPMMPVTHGIPFTKMQILLYTLLMIAVTYLAFAVDMFGWIYFIGVTLLNAGFLYSVIKLYRSNDTKDGLKTFRYSITYLGILFIVMLLDHYFAFLI